MAWITDDFEEARKAMSLPIGLYSPLWMAFGAATGAGVAWWWATRWTRAVNLEAMSGAAKAQVKAVEALVERESEAVSEAVEAAKAVLTAAQILEPPVSDAQVAEAQVAEQPLPVEIIAELAPLADDLTRLTGVGPKLAAALNERGITTFAQLAAWTEENAAAFDAELSLKGRVARDEWIAQARRLADEAKAD